MQEGTVDITCSASVAAAVAVVFQRCRPGVVPLHPRPDPGAPGAASHSHLYCHETRNSWNNHHSPAHAVEPVTERGGGWKGHYFNNENIGHVHVQYMSMHKTCSYHLAECDEAHEGSGRNETKRELERLLRGEGVEECVCVCVCVCIRTLSACKLSSS